MIAIDTIINQKFNERPEQMKVSADFHKWKIVLLKAAKYCFNYGSAKMVELESFEGRL